MTRALARPRLPTNAQIAATLPANLHLVAQSQAGVPTPENRVATHVMLEAVHGLPTETQPSKTQGSLPPKAQHNEAQTEVAPIVLVPATLETIRTKNVQQIPTRVQLTLEPTGLEAMDPKGPTAHRQHHEAETIRGRSPMLVLASRPLQFQMLHVDQHPEPDWSPTAFDRHARSSNL